MSKSAKTSTGERDLGIPQEPVLPMNDIQGIVAPGFFKPHQTLLGVVCDVKPDSVSNFKAFLRGISDEISSGAQTLEDRRQFRAAKSATGGKPSQGRTLTAVGFTFNGLKKLTPGASAIPSDAFQQGLAARAAFLGDPPDPNDEGNPVNWKVGGPRNSLDALFIVAGDTRADVDRRGHQLSAVLKEAGLSIVYSENGDVRPDAPGHEHFGFDDGVSQPGIRGRASDSPADFITPRHISPTQQPEHSLFGYPGQDLVWPGVLVLGHPATSPDPLVPGSAAPAVPDWTRNGSFLVFRRLRQDVGLFWRTMRHEAARLAALPGFEQIDDDHLAARLVGRWKSGTPVNRVPASDDEKLGKNKLANNHFRFDSDAAALPLKSGFKDPFPQSKADPAGITCPWAAHIRKVNTRDSGSDTGGRESTYARRLLRVGVPFGMPLEDRYAQKSDDPQKGDRGLLFLSIQASIEDQFEFLMARWMGDPTRPKTPGGHDVFVGQNDADGEDRVRECVIFGSGVQQATVATNAQWIIPTGGGYFFVPSIGALRQVIGG
jgi:Dyp-type peroxidase family